MVKRTIGKTIKDWNLAFSGVSGVFLSAFISYSVNGAELKPSWQSAWESIVKAAKKEGQVTVYTSRSAALTPDSGIFQKAYPGIKVVTVVGTSGGAQSMQRILTERRAGQYLADVVMGGSSSPLVLYDNGALDPIKPLLILPEVVDLSKWLDGRHRYIEPEAKYIFMYIGAPNNPVPSYNIKHVNPNDYKSFWDFLNPKLKGKITFRDARQSGNVQPGMRFLYYNPHLGPDFIRRFFTEMDVTLFRDLRQPIDWLAAGKFSLCFFCSEEDVTQARIQGLPVDNFIHVMKEGVGISAYNGTMGFVNKAPHPNAARIFINWLLSREGQLTIQRVSGTDGKNSLRIDIPKDMIAPHEQLVKGVSYQNVEDPNQRDMRPIIRLFEESLADAEKKKRKGS
jgi:iron(III) transport system substrate-binding protein